MTRGRFKWRNHFWSSIWGRLKKYSYTVVAVDKVVILYYCDFHRIGRGNSPDTLDKVVVQNALGFNPPLLKVYTNKKDRWDSEKSCLPTNCLKIGGNQIDIKYYRYGKYMCITCRYAPKTWFKLDFGLSRLLEIKCDSAIGLTIYDFYWFLIVA